MEPTEEIQRAYAEAWFRTIGMDEPDVEQMVAAELRDPMPWRLAALRAVLAIVERDQSPTQDAYDAAVRALEKHRVRAAAAEVVLRDLVDDDHCWYDHHGYCQAHGWLQTEPRCPHQRAKELL